MRLLKFLKTEESFILFLINFILMFIISLLNILIFHFFHFSWIIIIFFNFFLVLLFSILIATFFLNIMKGFFENIITFFSDNIVKKNNFKADNYFENQIFSETNKKLNDIIEKIKNKFEEKNIQYNKIKSKINKFRMSHDILSNNFKKNILKISNNKTRLEEYRKIKNDNLNFINKLKFDVSELNINSNKFETIKDKSDFILNQNNLILNKSKKIFDIVTNFKETQKNNFNFVLKIKQSFKTFNEIIEKLDLISINTTIEASKIEEAQSFEIFAKDLKISISKLTEEIDNLNEYIVKIKNEDKEINQLLSFFKEFNLNNNDFSDFFENLIDLLKEQKNVEVQNQKQLTEIFNIISELNQNLMKFDIDIILLNEQSYINNMPKIK